MEILTHLNRFRNSILLSVLFSLLTSCEYEEINNALPTVMCIGDSRAKGTYPNSTYREFLNGNFKKVGIYKDEFGSHTSFDGATTTAIISLFEKKKLDADVYLIGIGGNDITLGFPCKQILINIMSIINSIDPGKLIILEKIAPANFKDSRSDSLVKYNELISTINRNNVIIVDMYNGFNYESMTIDGGHYNKNGAQFIANKYLKFLP